MNYIALIGDIVDSKKIANRSEAQKSLSALLQELNQQYQAYLASPLTITTGDEFQALFFPNPHIFQIIDQLHLSFPHSIRFGIGVGEMLTDINREMSIGSDGPAYWRAREAINHIHDKNDYGSSYISVSTGHAETDQTINAILAATAFISAKWNSGQAAILKQLIAQSIYDEQFSQNILAKQMQLSDSALSKRFQSSGLKIYLRNKRVAMNLILQIAEEKAVDA